MKSLAWMIAAGFVTHGVAAWALAPKEVYKRVGPAVVLILGSDDGKSGSGGTGSIVTPEGKVITNAHVVLNERNQPFKILYVFLKPPKLTGDNSKDLANRYKARVLAASPAEELDLALIQIESPPPNLPTMTFGNPDEVEVGDEAIAIGHPEQGGLWTLTTGTVSTVISNFNRVQGKDVFQTEASVNRGNSGGPLLDENGAMIGINTMIARQGAGGVAITGVNFSLKSSVAVKWLAGQGMGLAYAPKGIEQPVVVAMAPEPARPAAGGSGGPTSATTPPADAAAGQSSTTLAQAKSGKAGGGEAAAASEPAAPREVEPKTVTEPPAATIVVAEAPPKAEETAKVREQGKALGKQKSAEKVVSGKPLDPKAAKPTYHTEKRAYSLDELRRQQMKELEDMMDEMRGKIRGKKRGDGMGLW